MALIDAKDEHVVQHKCALDECTTPTNARLGGAIAKLKTTIQIQIKNWLIVQSTSIKIYNNTIKCAKHIRLAVGG